MRQQLLILAIAAALGVKTASANTVDVGWANIQPCSKVEWTNNGPLGLPSPTVRTAPQETHVYLDYSGLANAQAAVNSVQSCALTAAGAATVTALVTNLAGAAPAFWGSFQSCVGNLYGQMTNLGLRTDTFCRW